MVSHVFGDFSTGPWIASITLIVDTAVLATLLVYHMIMGTTYHTLPIRNSLMIAWVYARSRLNNDTQIEGLLNAHVDTIN